MSLFTSAFLSDKRLGWAGVRWPGVCKVRCPGSVLGIAWKLKSVNAVWNGD